MQTCRPKVSIVISTALLEPDSYRKRETPYGLPFLLQGPMPLGLRD
jgi:hypothetical protein